MKRRIKHLYFSFVGKNFYLKTLHVAFFAAYHAGLLRNNSIYKYHYFVKNLIKKGDVVIDIGANLGYYTKLFSNWVGSSGKVYAVEPVREYVEIILWSTRKRKNIELLPYALGAENKSINMVVSGRHGYLRTGLPQVQTSGDVSSYEFSFPAEMKKGSELFSNLHRLDYIKCDIEGYEEFVIPEIKTIIEQHKPVIQIETWGEQRPIVEKLLNGLGYSKYELDGSSLNKKTDNSIRAVGDLIFIHDSKAALLQQLKERKLLD